MARRRKKTVRVGNYWVSAHDRASRNLRRHPYLRDPDGRFRRKKTRRRKKAAPQQRLFR